MDKCESVWVGGEGVCAADVCLSPAGIKEGGSRFIGEDKVQFKNIPQSYARHFYHIHGPEYTRLDIVTTRTAVPHT